MEKFKKMFNSYYNYSNDSMPKMDISKNIFTNFDFSELLTIKDEFQNLIIENSEYFSDKFIAFVSEKLKQKSEILFLHSERVTKLSNLIANTINDDVYYLKKDSFDKNSLQELNLAAWVHDIGKIIISSKILHKSKKLEADIDRLEIIRDRFEYLKKNLKNKKGSQFDTSEIDNDFEFIKEINTPVEYLSDDKIERLSKIAQKKVEIGNAEYHFLNNFEFENLKIRKGNLNKAEIAIIQSHVLLTADILSIVNFPIEFKNIEKIASYHHENLDGSGYPFGISSKDISISSRILAIADKYEALSSNIRPYKNKMLYDEIITVLYKKAQENKIDMKILNLIIDYNLFHKFEAECEECFQLDLISNDI